MPTPTSPALEAADRDLRLNAYLDGELDDADRAAVQAWLAANPAAQARFNVLHADRDALRAALQPALDEPTPDRLSRTVMHDSRSRWAQWRIAAGALLFVGGGLVGAAATWQQMRSQATPLARQQPLPWVQRAAVAHSVYVPEVRHPVEVRAREEHLARWLTRRIDAPVRLFDLQAHGYELVGGRLLPDVTGPSAQLMYENGARQRVTVYLRKPETDTPAAFRYEQQADVGLFYWVDDEVGYALAGQLPKEQLVTLASSIYQQAKKAQ
ncbi:anti-sigma factor [Schlegelella sp. S2-27]|uniref:Anti-sigma factor n=1 Tax=Caldimonas mangrovi TaxID=2944811 RepID=A0ABT0YL27_9BURK|nr:anti-sigma factor [Caldimonas mangrovi]MCM5679069.1 anti-sigma factor [Caldimonas mangrovi]